MKNGTRVEGKPSNAVLLEVGSYSNINKLSQAMLINGNIITKVFETYKLNYAILLDISNESDGLTGGGIKNPVFEVRLNDDDDSDIIYNVKDKKADSIRLVKVLGSTEVPIQGGLTTEVKLNGTAKASVKISYNGILPTGNYKIIFDAIPQKVQSVKLPESGKEIFMTLNISWIDVGVEETIKTHQLKGKLDILPLPKLQ